MDKTFKLFKDGVFLGERPRSEVEQIAKANEEFGYRFLISDEESSSGLAILEKDPKTLEIYEKYIKGFNESINRFIREKFPQPTIEEYVKTVLHLISNISEREKKKR